MERTSLDGEWQLDFFPQPEGGAIRTLPLDVATETVSAQVPGNCELDLARAGLLPEPERGLNVREWRRYEGHQWLYSRNFEAPGIPAGGKATLLFEGIDTLADIFLNGEKIGETANMLIEHRFDVTRRLRAGKNTLQVLIRSAFLEQQATTVGFHSHHMSMAEGATLRKAAHMGGWDIFPRLYVSGLWRGVSIEVEGPVRVRDAFWVTGDHSRGEGGENRCRVMVQFRVEGPAALFWEGAKFRLTASRDGRTVLSAVRHLNTSGNRVTLDARGFDLWWPAGSGEHPLYEAKIEILSPSGEVLASDTRRIGFRTVELVRRDRRGDDPGIFLFKVNGEPIYMRGTNWVPTDAIPSRQANRILPTLELVEELHCNMVRSWGGGVYEPDFFYDWCDEHGVLVWQDFMTGCLLPPQDDAYAAATAAEARSVALRLRNHPCLALWAGNNENDHSLKWSRMAGVEVPDPNTDRSSRETIPRVLRDFDPTRPYLPSSPYVSPEVAAGLAESPEDHLWGARNWYKEPFYVDSPVWFASETGWHGCPDRASLEEMMTPNCVYPWKSPGEFDWNDEWRLKASCPFLDPNVLWDRNDIMIRQIRNLFGEVGRDLDEFIFQSQFFQAEALKTMIEVFRARKFTRAGGLLWWNVRDGWPQISDAVVDWYGRRKAAFAAIRDAQRDILALLLDDHSAWIVNDRLTPVDVRASWRDRATGATLLEGSWRIPANASLRVGEVPFAGQGVIDIEFSVDGAAAERNHYLAGDPPFDVGGLRALWNPEFALPAPPPLRPRAEMLDFLERNVFGCVPDAALHPALSFEELSPEVPAMEGRAVRRRVRIRFAGPGGEGHIDVLAFLPVADSPGSPVPATLLLCNRDPAENMDPDRVRRTPFWDAERIVSRGWAAVAIHTGSSVPDNADGFEGHLQSLFLAPGETKRPDSWGTIAAWAWCGSRVMDWIETEPRIDARRVMVAGHSRCGKTALWCAAKDERFAMAVSSCSGCGGAKLNRTHLPESEHIAQLVKVFPHWFCGNFAAFAGHDLELPFDQHWLLALVAPRRLFISSATLDAWAGQPGEFLAAKAASSAWREAGLEGLPESARFPEPDEPVLGGCVAYNLHSGAHTILSSDWDLWIDFAEQDSHVHG